MYKSGLLFAVASSTAQLCEDARRLFAWQEIDQELPTISAEETQVAPLGENIKKAKRDLRESVWRSFNNVALLVKNNEVGFIDLGKAHSSAAKDIIQFISDELMNVDDMQKGDQPEPPGSELAARFARVEREICERCVPRVTPSSAAIVTRSDHSDDRAAFLTDRLCTSARRETANTSRSISKRR